MRRFRVTCDNCNGTGKNGNCDWCEGSGYHVVTTQGDKVPLGAFEEIDVSNSKENFTRRIDVSELNKEADRIGFFSSRKSHFLKKR